MPAASIRLFVYRFTMLVLVILRFIMPALASSRPAGPARVARSVCNNWTDRQHLSTNRPTAAAPQCRDCPLWQISPEFDKYLDLDSFLNHFMLTELTRAWGAYAQDQYISVTITQAGTPPKATVKAGPSLQYELAFAGTGRGVDLWQEPTDYIGWQSAAHARGPHRPLRSARRRRAGGWVAVGREGRQRSSRLSRTLAVRGKFGAGRAMPRCSPLCPCAPVPRAPLPVRLSGGFSEGCSHSREYRAGCIARHSGSDRRHSYYTAHCD